MSIFNKIIPWFIPTKDDQRKWYGEELSDSPKEVRRILDEFMSLSAEYDSRFGNFESQMARNLDQYQEYLELKSMAQKLSFLWQRLEYKRSREYQLKEMMKNL